MAPGESIRGQIHLELPKATPVHSIEVCLTGTVTALDGARLGSMKTVTILEECKTVATASVTNTRTNTTRRHTTPAQPTATTTANEEPSRGRTRRNSVTSSNTTQDSARSPAIPIQNTIAAAVSATIAAQQNNSSRRLSTELMSRTLSLPSPYYSSGQNTSTLSLNRSISPTPADLRGRRASFSANVDTPMVNNSFGGALGRNGHNMSMINISTISQFPLDDGTTEDPSTMPEAPSYDPPDYERIFTTTASERNSGESSNTDATASSQSGSTNSEAVASSSSAITTASSDETSAPTTISSPSNSSEDEGRGDQTTSAAASTPTPPAEPAEQAEPKAVLMQPGNYVIPFSIRIPANTVMSLPGSFSDPVGSISYQLKAVMRQILPSPDPYNPRALIVEPTFSSATQVIKLIPMNDPTYMPLYNLPFETDSVRANVGHWVWSTGFMEAHAWVPKQGYRPGRMVPLVIHIVNHSDARQVTVETTLCKCLHYGSGLSKIRAMGIAGQGYLMDPTLTTLGTTDISDEGPVPTAQTTEPSGGRRRTGRRSNSNQNSRSRQEAMIPSPPASPYGSNFPTTPTNEGEDESPEGSVHGSQMASPNSMASISSQWESNNSNSSDSNGTPLASGSMIYSPESHPSATTSLSASGTSVPQMPLPIVQHQREKISKSKTLINCSLAVDREIQKTILVPIPHSAGYSILNAPLLEVSYEIVVKIRAEKVYSRGIRLCIPIVVVVPEEGDLDEEEDLLMNAGLVSPDIMARDFGMAFSGDEYELGDQGSCPPYEVTAGSGSRRRSRSRR
ncbi:hypothetical protein BGX27_006560 [Mortierella sp. AM989]|nr:hypothetical protein BGX27_006560 [Mortierella sp. AM989]